MTDKKLTWTNLDWATATVEDVKKIIENGGNVNDEVRFASGAWREEHYEWRSPLALATAAKNKEVIAFLLENKADPNYILCDRANHWGDTHWRHQPMLSLAIETQDREIIDLHLKYVKDPFEFFTHITKPTDMRPDDRVEYVKTLVEAYHPIMVAIHKKDRETLDKLLTFRLPEYQEKMFKREFEPRCGEGEGLNLPRGGIWGYLYALWAKKDQAERRALRQKLAEVVKQGDQKQKEEIIEKLLGKKGTNYDGTIYHSEDPLRRQEASEYELLRQKFDSETARAARRAMQMKRARLLEKVVE